jgi:lysozyme
MKELLNEWKKFINEADKKSVAKKKTPSVKPTGNYSNTYTENAIALIKKFEKFSPVPYQNDGDKPTIGYGTTFYVSSDGKTITPVTKKDKTRVTPEIADKYMRNFLNYITMRSINKYLKRKDLNRNQLDALVSIMYNKGNSSFLNSPIFTAVNKNPNDPNLKNLFLADAAGKDPGILIRRQAEWNLYSLQGVEDTAIEKSRPFEPGEEKNKGAVKNGIK